MGLLFNTEDTVAMTALVNRHFSAEAHGGAIKVWRDQKNEVKKFAKPIWTLADDNDLVPAKDLAKKTRSRWKKWLDQLKSEPAAVAADPPPFDNAGTAPAGTLAADTATYDNVDKELRRQIFNALNDINCVEISFTVVPSTTAAMSGHNISISKGQVVTLPASTYLYIVTISTVRVDQF